MMHRACTYEGCGAVSHHVISDAIALCDTHKAVFDDASASNDPRRLVAFWVKGVGGAAAATERMRPTIDLAARFAERLKELRRK